MLWCLLISLLAPGVISQESWVVNTEYGDVRGYWSEEYQVWQFLGIPYAAPPVGKLRFKAPVAPEPWTDVYNATEIKSVCWQSSVYSGGLENEDCLFINIFVPESARTGNYLPVLYFAHGGGFLFGSSIGYNPHHTTKHDVILVTFNYRLGAFGYMCLGTEHIPGNAGLKDHIATLRWTNNNIANFGGDPNSVTIYGESSGAGNVESLILSPVTNGLFQRAIIESGSALLDWSYNREPLITAKSIALDLGCSNVDDLESMGECLEEASPDDLFRAAQSFGHSLCVENNIEGIENAIIEDPFETLQKSNYVMVPSLYAITELESAISVGDFNEHIDRLNNNEDNFYIPSNIKLTLEETIQANNNFNRLYFNSSLVTSEALFEFLQFYSDRMFVNGFYKSAILNARNGNTVYLLEYAYAGGFNQNSYLAQMFNTASHADIVANIMDLGHYNNETLEQDQIIRDRMTEIWTNFVKYGIPEPTNTLPGLSWQPFTEANPYYLKMDVNVSVGILEHQERLSYWAELYANYYNPLPFVGAGARPSLCSFMIFSFIVTFLVNLM